MNESAPSPSVLVPRALIESMREAQAMAILPNGNVSHIGLKRVLSASQDLIHAVEREAGKDEAMGFDTNPVPSICFHEDTCSEDNCPCDEAAAPVEPLCECGHAKTLHEFSRYECSDCGWMTCKRFAPATPVTVPREDRGYCPEWYCELAAKTTPRVARSLSDLQVGQVVAFAQIPDGPLLDSDGWGWVSTVKRKANMAAYFLNGNSVDETYLANYPRHFTILSDPPAAVPAVLPAEAAWREWNEQPGNGWRDDGSRHAVFVAGFDAAAAAQGEKP